MSRQHAKGRKKKRRRINGVQYSQSSEYTYNQEALTSKKRRMMRRGDAGSILKVGVMSFVGVTNVDIQWSLTQLDIDGRSSRS